MPKPPKKDTPSEKAINDWNKPDETRRTAQPYSSLGGAISISASHALGGDDILGGGDDAVIDSAPTKLPGAQGETSVTVDFRDASPKKFMMPPNIELIDAEIQLEECEDGARALNLPEGGYLKLRLPKPPVRRYGGMLGAFGAGMAEPADDGRVRCWSIMMCIRIEQLPTIPLPILHGGMPPELGETFEHIHVYKNGGVGALGSMGTQECAVRAERWAWVTITRKGDELKTYVNGLLCAKVSIKSDAPGQESDRGRRKKRKGSLKRRDGDEDEDEDEQGGRAHEGTPAAPKDKFALERQGCALFAQPIDPDAPPTERSDGEERGLMLRYLSVHTNANWSEEEIRARLVCGSNPGALFAHVPLCVSNPGALFAHAPPRVSNPGAPVIVAALTRCVFGLPCGTARAALSRRGGGGDGGGWSLAAGPPHAPRALREAPPYLGDPPTPPLSSRNSPVSRTHLPASSPLGACFLVE